MYENQYDNYIHDIPDNHIVEVGICHRCRKEIYDYEEYETDIDGFLIHAECVEEE